MCVCGGGGGGGLQLESLYIDNTDNRYLRLSKSNQATACFQWTWLNAYYMYVCPQGSPGFMVG